MAESIHQNRVLNADQEGSKPETAPGFTNCRPFPGVTHITDAMGVSFTLIEGEDSALLFDAGYGLADVSAYVRTLTEKPVELILSHGHHDHILGARWFGHSLMDPADREEFSLRTARPQLLKVQKQAEEKGLSVPDDFFTAPVPMPEALRYIDWIGDFDASVFDLGDREAWLIRVPGHTRGSAVMYVPDLQLMLTGDDWNPCTWMWFPCSLPAARWRDNMLKLVSQVEEEAGEEILHVICSHQPAPRKGSEMKEFLAFMTDERLRTAPAADMGASVNTHRITVPERGWTLVFDADK